MDSDGNEQFEDAVESLEDEKSIEQLVDEVVTISGQKKVPETEPSAPVDLDAQSTNAAKDEINDDDQRKFEAKLTAEELDVRLATAIDLKEDGNASFKVNDYEKAAELYTEALKQCPVAKAKQRAMIYANRAAAKLKLDDKEAAVADCTKAITFDEHYLKAYLRRAHAYESLERLDESLADFKKILELDPTHKEAQGAMLRLPVMIEKRNEEMKREALGKLKELGNMVLKPFGLSTDNFQMVPNPEGGYSINFKQGGAGASAGKRDRDEDT